MIPVFITGTGTGIGKTIISVILSHALDSDYWKPIQSGRIEGTDTEFASGFISTNRKCHPEVYNLAKPASPHIAAREEGQLIETDLIREKFRELEVGYNAFDYLVIEGAGGLLVPLNEKEFITDLILKLRAKVVLVSRNYLGSINHSLLTASVCRQLGIDVVGWVFNGPYVQYQEEIARWSGYPIIGSIPDLEHITVDVLRGCAMQLRENLLTLLERNTND